MSIKNTDALLVKECSYFRFDLSMVAVFLIPGGQILVFPEPTSENSHYGLDDMNDEFLRAADVYGSLNPQTVEAIRQRILNGPEKTKEQKKTELKKLVDEL